MAIGCKIENKVMERFILSMEIAMLENSREIKEMGMGRCFTMRVRSCTM